MYWVGTLTTPLAYVAGQAQGLQVADYRAYRDTGVIVLSVSW